jgi:predicted GNAT superfamily acetyltransferase
MSSAAPPSPITVRPVATVAEYRACQEVQRRAWGITEDGYVVPVATMISVQHAGGLVLGAFQGERLIGFTFGYLGRVRGRWALYSQLAGVDPGVQAEGVGGQMKHAQRDWARAQGLALVAWTYDPLQAGNANFNLHRLGAAARAYHVNFYGERSDALNAGLDTDRLLVEWPVEDAPRPPAGPAPAVDLVRGEAEAGALLRPRLDLSPLDRATAAGSTLRIEVPATFAALKDRDAALARDWQLAVRAAFQAAFAAGYAAVDFERVEADGGRRGFYLLRPARD